MDEYFWVIMLVLYLIFQVLGGRKKKKQARRPDATAPQRSDAPGRQRPETLGQTRTRDAELDDALHEIRRALGFPDAGGPPHGSEPEIEMQVEAPPETIRQPEHRTVDSERLHQQPPPPPLARRSMERPTPVPQSAGIPNPVTSPPGVGGSDVGSQPDQERISRRLRKSIPALKAGRSKDIQEIPPVKSRLSDIQKRLSNPQTFQEAFLIKEILDLPRSKRPMR